MSGESKTKTIRRALEERKARLKGKPIAERRARVLKFLKRHVWPAIPLSERGRRRTRAEEDDLLGYGPCGV